MKPGRVTRSSIVLGSWQSTQETGCAPPVVCAEELVRVPVAQLADALEALLDLLGGAALGQRLAAELAVERHDRGVAVQTVSRLLGLARHVALGELLILEHEGVAAAVAVVHREEVAGEDAGEPGVALGLLRRERALGTDQPAAVLGARRLGGAPVAVVLSRPVDAPLLGVDVVLGDLDQLEEGVLAPPACAGRC